MHVRNRGKRKGAARPRRPNQRPVGQFHQFKDGRAERSGSCRGDAATTACARAAGRTATDGMDAGAADGAGGPGGPDGEGRRAGAPGAGAAARARRATPRGRPASAHRARLVSKNTADPRVSSGTTKRRSTRGMRDCLNRQAPRILQHEGRVSQSGRLNEP